MIKIIETVTFKDGSVSETEKEFSCRISMMKALQRGPFHNSVIYEITKNGQATIPFADATVTMVVVEEPDEVLAERMITRGDPGK